MATADERRLIDVQRHAEVREAWRCPVLTASIPESGSPLFHTGNVNRLDGKAHMTRRRAMARLIGREGHKAFRDRILFPTIDGALNAVLADRDADGFARVEVMRWARRANFVMAAALAGFDGMEDEAAADELFELWRNFYRGRPSAYQASTGSSDRDSDAYRETLACRQRILDDYYAPSLARRKVLAARVAEGQMAEEDLPHDLLMLIALQADPMWDDPGVAERETLFVLTASVNTTGSSLYWVLREALLWIDTHSDCRGRLSDDAFLYRLAAEGMRLHTVVQGFPRLALDDVRLGLGTEIRKGELAIIRSWSANTDPAVWGEDALDFNPDREPPDGMERYGYAFGSGPHSCFGKSLVIGSEGVDGSLVYFLKALLRANVEADPDRPAPPLVPSRGAFVREPVEYFVRFRA
jgi:cytochrome P450